MTDEWQAYRRPGREFAGHLTVNHSAEEWVRGEAHTQTVEGYFSIFKRGMKGIYQHWPGCGQRGLIAEPTGRLESRRDQDHFARHEERPTTGPCGAFRPRRPLPACSSDGGWSA
jgi:hypothetical protein